MNIQTAKIELVKAILIIDNSDFIQKIANFIQKENIDFWNELSTPQKKEIKKGIEELDCGKRISYESFLQKIS